MAATPRSAVGVDVEPVSPTDPAFLYLDLLARAVCNYLYLGGTGTETAFPVRDEQYDEASWTIPPLARPHTALRFVQLENARRIGEEIIRESVPGDFVEAGVWRGGVLILLAGILKVHGQHDRTLWAADSFAGIPRSVSRADEVDLWSDRWEAGLDEVESNIRRYGLLDDRIRFLPGLFNATLPLAPINRIALLRIDADTYESTMDVLVNLYDRVSPGGYVIIDDWHLGGCREGVLDFRARRGISAPIKGVFVPDDDQPMEAFWKVP